MAIEPKDQGPRKEAVPDIVGQTASNANSQITSAGFDVGTVTDTDAPSGNPGVVGNVVSQVQTAGNIMVLSTDIDYTKYNPHFPPYFPPFFPPHFPPYFPPFFPPHFPPYFPPFFPPHFPPSFKG